MYQKTISKGAVTETIRTEGVFRIGINTKHIGNGVHLVLGYPAAVYTDTNAYIISPLGVYTEREK